MDCPCDTYRYLHIIIIPSYDSRVVRDYATIVGIINLTEYLPKWSIDTTLRLYYILGRYSILYFSQIITHVATKTCGDIFGGIRIGIFTPFGY